MKHLAQRAHRVGSKKVNGTGQRRDAGEREREERFSCEHDGKVARRR